MTYVEKSEILHIWHVCDVENVTIYANVMQFLRAFMWRKIAQKYICGEKMTNIRSDPHKVVKTPSPLKI